MGIFRLITTVILTAALIVSLVLLGGLVVFDSLISPDSLTSLVRDIDVGELLPESGLDGDIYTELFGEDAFGDETEMYSQLLKTDGVADVLGDYIASLVASRIDGAAEAEIDSERLAELLEEKLDGDVDREQLEALTDAISSYAESVAEAIPADAFADGAFSDTAASIVKKAAGPGPRRVSAIVSLVFAALIVLTNLHRWRGLSWCAAASAAAGGVWCIVGLCQTAIAEKYTDGLMLSSSLAAMLRNSSVTVGAVCLAAALALYLAGFILRRGKL